MNLPALRIDGVYAVEIHATGTACGGTFERYESFSVYVGRIADPKRTRVRVSAGDRPNVANVVLQPMDRTGTSLGSGLGGRLSASVVKGSAQVIDPLDGSYLIRASWSPTVRAPVLTVKIDDVVLRVPIVVSQKRPRGTPGKKGSR